jgi:hypothetical protein
MVTYEDVEPYISTDAARQAIKSAAPPRRRTEREARMKAAGAGLPEAPPSPLAPVPPLQPRQDAPPAGSPNKNLADFL